MFYIIFAHRYSLLVPLETLLYMLRTGRPWTSVFSLIFFFSTGVFQQTLYLLFLITGFKKTSSAISENKSRKLAEAERKDLWQHVAQKQKTSQRTSSSTSSLGSAKLLLKVCTLPGVHSSEPNKMILRFVWIGVKNSSFFPQRQKGTLFMNSLLKDRTTWREQRSLHMYMHTLMSSHVLQSFTGHNQLQTG